MKIDEVLRQAAELISRRDAELLLSSVIDRDRAWIRSHGDSELTIQVAEALAEQVKRRASGEPLQYITGVQEFFGLPLHVAPGVLIPRPETEHLVEAVLGWAHAHGRSLKIVDVGTGSGAIACALATNLPTQEVTATDLSDEALEIAKRNAERLGLADRVRFVQGDLLAMFGPCTLDVVVSNPPYIPTLDAAEMQREVVGHEPHGALFAGADGLMIYRRLIPEAAEKLRRGGLLAMEIGFGQQPSIEQLLLGWQEVRFLDDYAGIPRVVLAEKSL